VNLPSNVLVVMGVGPTGGVQGGGIGTLAINTVSFSPDKVVVQGSSPILPEGLVRLTVLTPSSHYTGSLLGDGEGTTANPSSANRPAENKGLFQPLLQSWRRAIDALFSIKDWLHTSAVAPAPNTTALDALFEDMGVQDEAWDVEPEAAQTSCEAKDTLFTQVSRSRWVNTLAALGAAVLFTGRKPRRPRQEVRLRLEPREDNR
jgi:hypothetical protein